MNDMKYCYGCARMRAVAWKIGIYTLLSIMLFTTFACKQKLNKNTNNEKATAKKQSDEKPKELLSNEITITVKGDSGFTILEPSIFKVQKEKNLTFGSIKGSAVSFIKCKTGKVLREWRRGTARGNILKESDVFENDAIVFAVSKDMEPLPEKKPDSQPDQKPAPAPELAPTPTLIFLTIKADSGYVFKESGQPCKIEVEKGSIWCNIKTKVAQKIELKPGYEDAGVENGR